MHSENSFLCNSILIKTGDIIYDGETEENVKKYFKINPKLQIDIFIHLIIGNLGNQGEILAKTVD